MSHGRGGYRKNGLPPGDAALIVNDQTACVGGARVVVDEGETARVDLVLRTGRLVELRCPGEECAGVPLSFLSVSDDSGLELAGHLGGAAGTRFSERGRLGLGCVQPGVWTFSWWALDRRWAAEVEIDADGPEEEPVVVEGLPAG